MIQPQNLAFFSFLLLKTCLNKFLHSLLCIEISKKNCQWPAIKISLTKSDYLISNEKLNFFQVHTSELTIDSMCVFEYLLDKLIALVNDECINIFKFNFLSTR